jgi:hypothetical protein
MPRVFADGRSPKYEHPPTQPPILDILPRYQSRLTDPTIPLWITEGAKKADALATLYDVAIVPAAINGVYGWSQGGILKDFDAVILAGRDVVLVPDGDISTKWAVAQAIERLAHVLTRRGATVRLLLLPDAPGGGKVGVDDYIASGATTADLEARIMDWSIAMHTVAAGLKAHGQGPTRHQATIAELVDAWAAETDAWAYDPNRDHYMAWTGTHWEIARPMDVDAKISDLLRAHGRDLKSGAANDIARFTKAKLARIFTRREGLANFANGTFDRESGRLRPHDRADGLTYCLPFEYDPLAPMDKIEQFLTQSIPDPVARLCLMTFVGLAILGDTTRENFLTFTGVTRGGKSTLLGLAQYVTGNTESPRSFAGASLLSDETEGKRSRYQWSTKRLIAIDELKAEVMLKAEEKIKILSAHGGAEQRGMHKDEQTINRWEGKIIFAANDAPRFVDNSGSLQARMRIIHFPTSRLGSEDFNLFSKLTAQAGAFASVCTGLAAALLRYEDLPLPESASMKALKDELGHQNPLKAFVQDACMLGIGERCSQTELRTAYTAYCEAHGYKAKGDHMLYRSLKDCGYQVDNTGYVHTGRAYAGIRLRTSTDPHATTATTVPTVFDQYVGGFLSDWDAIKQASATTATTPVGKSSIASYALLFAACEPTKKQAEIGEAGFPLNAVGVSADCILPHSNGQNPATTTASPPAQRGGHEPAASPYVDRAVWAARQRHGSPPPAERDQAAAAELAALTGEYDR